MEDMTYHIIGDAARAHSASDWPERKVLQFKRSQRNAQLGHLPAQEWQWGIRRRARHKTRQSTLDFLLRMGSTPVPVTGTSKSSGSSSSNVGFPHSTDRSRITQTTGTMNRSSPLVDFQRASSITTMQAMTTEPHLVVDGIRPPASSRRNLALARSLSSVSRKQAYTAALLNAPSASWSASTPLLLPQSTRSHRSSGQTVLPTKCKTFKMLLPTPLHRMFRPAQTLVTHTNSPCIRTCLLSILSARKLWSNVRPSPVENWYRHGDRRESCSLPLIHAHFSGFTHNFAQASAPRPALSNGNYGNSSNYSNGRRKSLGADSPEVATTG